MKEREEQIMAEVRCLLLPLLQNIYVYRQMYCHVYGHVYCQIMAEVHWLLLPLLRNTVCTARCTAMCTAISWPRRACSLPLLNSGTVVYTALPRAL